MNFPTIKTLDDILNHIEGRNEFIHIKKDDYSLIDYAVQTSDTFKNCDSLMFLRECRGIAFDLDGNIISRPLHKFKNLNESEEVLVENIDFNKPYVVMDKLDGSMLRPIKLKHGIRWATRKGISDVAMHAEVFVAKHDRYIQFAKKMIDLNMTPIFEFVSPVRGVVKYPEDNMILLALRNIYDGSYYTYEELCNYAFEFDIPVVKIHETPDDITEFVLRSKKEQGNEGYILRFNDGEMLKVKNDWYVSLHKIKSQIENENEIILHSINNTLDDIKAALDTDRQRINEVEENFWRLFEKKKETLLSMYNAHRVMSNNDIKTFSINHSSSLHPFDKNLIFHQWNGKNLHDGLLNICIKNLNKQKSFKELMEYLKGE